MKITHRADVWITLTEELEHKGKLDEVESIVARAAARSELYNEVMRIADTVEEVLILAYYVGYRRGGFDVVRAMQPTRVVGG